MEQAQMVAGSLAGLIFAAGSVDMVVKAWRTKDLRSYSFGQILLNNNGNLFYWLYVVSLPFGPIWLLIGYLRYERTTVPAYLSKLRTRHSPR